MKDIFDLQNLEDLPKSLKKSLSNKKKRQYHSLAKERIERLFDLADRDLTIEEVTVGLYRMFGLEKKRQYILCILASCTKAGLIERVGGKRTGVYRKTQKKKSFFPLWSDGEFLK